MRLLLLLGILLCLAQSGHAAEPTPALPTPGARVAADVASYGTLGAGLALETIDAIHCPDWSRCVWKEVFGLSVVWASTGILKTVVQRPRPCAPSCGIDSVNSSFPSGHAAFAGQTVWGEHLGWKTGLAIATSGLRVAAGKHHVTDVGAGFLLGWGTTVVW